MSVQATGAAPLSFQWFFQNASISGATNSLLMLANLQFSNTGDYYVEVRNPVGTATSRVVRVTVGFGLTVTNRGVGTVELSPTLATYEPGSSVQLRAVPTGERQFIRWSGEVAATANPLALTVNRHLQITAEFSTLPGDLKWVFATGGGIQSQLALGRDGIGKLYALDGGTGTLNWTFTTFGGLTSPAIGEDCTVYVASEDRSVYAIAGSARLADSPWPKFQHDLQNTGRHGSPPTVLRQPSRVVLREGAPGEITVKVAGTPTPELHWLFNDQPIPGATTTNLIIPSVTRADEGLYTVLASNMVGQVVSRPIPAVVSNVDPQSFVGLKWEGGNAGPLSLEATAQLGEPANWHSISNYPSSTAPQQYVELDPTDAARFYRLNAPVALAFSAAGWLNGWWLTEAAGTRVRVEMVSAATGWTAWQELATLPLPATARGFVAAMSARQHHTAVSLVTTRHSSALNNS